ncbi:hypothetical protein [Nocardia sp. NPDC051463]|uniref:hypothetical protein n=1 Tax=Nocardia sp. NPDC051463 TaxID=3154845 RepID=UPI00344BB60C
MDYPPVPTRSRVGRAAATLALVSSTLHAACGGTHCTAVWLVVLPALMSLGCLWCAWHLWTGPSLAAWTMTAAMSSAMLMLHVAVPMPGAVMHWAHLPALTDLALSGGILLRAVVSRGLRGPQVPRLGGGDPAAVPLHAVAERPGFRGELPTGHERNAHPEARAAQVLPSAAQRDMAFGTT